MTEMQSQKSRTEADHHTAHVSMCRDSPSVNSLSQVRRQEEGGQKKMILENVLVENSPQ